MEVELVPVPSRLEALLAAIPSDFTYPDDVADFVISDPKSQEVF